MCSLRRKSDADSENSTSQKCETLVGEDVEAVGKEKRQSSGGRLDILLKDTVEEPATMYEVEVMLGETDETHIIRTIEYWDNEKRRWPQRQHVAVLVAEHINRRFFNVIHLLSHSIPIVAIQASLIQSNGSKSLFFTKVLDTYEEIDDGTSTDATPITRDHWMSKAKWTLETADGLLSTIQDLFTEPKLNYVKEYISITVAGYIYFSLRKRSGDKSLLSFRVSASLQDEMAKLLDSNSISYVQKPKRFQITVDKQMIQKDKDIIRVIASLVKKSWEAES